MAGNGRFTALENPVCRKWGRQTATETPCKSPTAQAKGRAKNKQCWKDIKRIQSHNKQLVLPDLSADDIPGIIGEGSPRLALAVIFLATAVLGLFISNTATAVLMAPVAMTAAEDLGASPYPFTIIVMIVAVIMVPILLPP